MSNKISLKSVLTAGTIATAAMTAFTFMAPLMGFEMNIPGMLAGTMGAPIIIGWAAHFMIGIVLAFNFAALFLPNIKQSNKIFSGALFGVIPWLLAQIMVMPMMSLMNGADFTSGLFSGSFVISTASLMGHILYGIVLGAFYKPETRTAFNTAKV